MRERVTGCAVLFALANLACGGKPFDVKSRADLPVPVPAAAAAVNHNGLNVEAAAVIDEDYLFDTFDANLLLAGVLPVIIKLTNSSDAPVELKRARIKLVGEGDESFKQLKARSAFQRLINYYGISTYSKDGYRTARADFESYELNLEEPLASGGIRNGFIFFSIPSQASRSGYTLLIRRLRSGKSDDDRELLLKLN